jgi:hypothetical protein
VERLAEAGLPAPESPKIDNKYNSVKPTVYIMRIVGDISTAVSLSMMGGQHPSPGAASASYERACSGTHAGHASDSGAATGPQQTTCNRARARGPATGSKTNGSCKRYRNANRLPSEHALLPLIIQSVTATSP